MENIAAKTWWQLCAIFAGPTAAEGEVRHQREMLRRFQVMTNKTKQTKKEPPLTTHDKDNKNAI